MMYCRKKDPFPKSVTDACRVLAGWKTQYWNSNNSVTEANDGVAFAITDGENKENGKKG